MIYSSNDKLICPELGDINLFKYNILYISWFSSFKINSLMYNIESQSKDLIISLDCSYNDVNNTLSIIVNENIDHNNLTKEVALTLIKFVQKINIEKLYLIVYYVV